MSNEPLDLTQNDLDIIRLVADGGNRSDVMTIKNTTVLALLDRLEAAEAKVAAGLAHCESAEWMADDNGDQWEVVTVAVLRNAIGGGA